MATGYGVGRVRVRAQPKRTALAPGTVRAGMARWSMSAHGEKTVQLSPSTRPEWSIADELLPFTTTNHRSRETKSLRRETNNCLGVTRAIAPPEQLDFFKNM